MQEERRVDVSILLFLLARRSVCGSLRKRPAVFYTWFRLPESQALGRRWGIACPSLSQDYLRLGTRRFASVPESAAARRVAAFADGVIVGSALGTRIGESDRPKEAARASISDLRNALEV